MPKLQESVVVVVVVVLLLFEVHEVDEEEGAEEGRLHLHVQVEGEADAEVVGVGEGLPSEPAPLLGDEADLGHGGQGASDMPNLFCRRRSPPGPPWRPP